MLKLALPAGIAAEWLFGPAAHSFLSLGMAAMRAVMFAALAWLVVEAIGAVWKAVDSLDE